MPELSNTFELNSIFEQGNVLELSTCIGSYCHLKGSYNVIQIFQQLIEEYSLHDKIKFRATFCMKQCQNSGVSVSINGQEYNIMPETARAFFESEVMKKLL